MLAGQSAVTGATGMFSKTGKATHDMYRAIQTRDDVVNPHLRKKKAVKLLNDVEIMVHGHLSRN